MSSRGAINASPYLIRHDNTASLLPDWLLAQSQTSNDGLQEITVTANKTDDTKVINLIKSIERTAEEESGDPFLITMADRAKQIRENYEDRQTSTQETLEELLAEIERNEQRKKMQAEKGYDSLLE
jgi:type I restriction enzyme, R subunit